MNIRDLINILVQLKDYFPTLAFISMNIGLILLLPKIVRGLRNLLLREPKKKPEDERMEMRWEAETDSEFEPSVKLEFGDR